MSFSLILPPSPSVSVRKTSSPSLLSVQDLTAGCHSAIAHQPPKRSHSAFDSSPTFLGSTLTSSFLLEARLAASAALPPAASAQDTRTAVQIDFMVPSLWAFCDLCCMATVRRGVIY